MNDTELLNWCLEKVTHKSRLADQPITEEDYNVLKAGTYTDPDTGEVTNFGLPETISSLLT